MQRISLADDWYVYSRDDAFSLVTSIPNDAVHTSVPYDALMAQGPRADAPSAGATGYFDPEVYYYQRELTLDPAWEGKRLILKFEGIFSTSFIYVNGSQVGTGAFGYASVTCDITDYVRFDAPNTLLVICKSEPHSSRWYAGAGICRPVYLMVAEPVYTELDSLFITTQEITAEGSARVRVQALLANDTGRIQNLDARLRIFDDAGDVLNESFPVRVPARYELDRQFYLPAITPWSEDDPHLYWVELTLGNDVTHVRCGLRTESWDPAHGLRINGEPVLLRGACIHHDEGLLGGVATLAYERWRVSLLKEAGFNAIRSAHNHASAQLLRACDELGVYVLDEICDMWTKMKGFGDFAQFFGAEWENVTGSLVRESRNHPSVVGYSTGNEISDINTERGFEVAHELYAYIRSLDPTRFVTNGVNGAFAAGEELIDIAVDITGQPREVFEAGDVNRFMALLATQMNDIVTHPVVTRVLERLDSSVDVAGYNYMTARYERDAQAYPQRVMLGTETNPRLIAVNWDIITKVPACIGEFTWTGWDYIGELGSAPYPAWRNSAGDLSLFGFRTPVSFWREIVFGLRTQPYLAVRPPETFGTPREFGPWRFTDAVASWSWDVEPGTPLCVELYAPNGPVELLLNGEPVGAAETSECYALFEVPYAPGTLTAVGADGQRWELRSTTGELHAVCDDFESEGWLISRIHLEDEHGTWAFGNGRAYDCTREGYDFVAAASESTQLPAINPCIELTGQGALAIYRKA